MKKRFFLVVSMMLSWLVYAQETFTIGNTEYYYDRYYSSTGKPEVKRSEFNKKQFLRSKGYEETPVGYEIDHIIPLCEGGTDDPSNMQLLTIEQHKSKTAKERARRSSSTYSSTPVYNSNSTYEEPVIYATYSRTDSDGKIIYKGSQGDEYYANSNGNKTYVKSKSSSNSYYSTPTPTSSSSREIQTGPRGGQYYINSNGNKTYIKKK